MISQSNRKLLAARCPESQLTERNYSAHNNSRSRLQEWRPLRLALPAPSPFLLSLLVVVHLTSSLFAPASCSLVGRSGGDVDAAAAAAATAVVAAAADGGAVSPRNMVSPAVASLPPLKHLDLNDTRLHMAAESARALGLHMQWEDDDAVIAAALAAAASAEGNSSDASVEGGETAPRAPWLVAESDAELLPHHQKQLFGAEDGDDGESGAHGGSRRMLKGGKRGRKSRARGKYSNTAEKLLGDAWHYTMIAQWFARRSVCLQPVTAAAAELKKAGQYLKARRPAYAKLRVRKARQTILDCLKRLRAVDVNARKYSVLAAALLLRSELAIAPRTSARGGKSSNSKRRPRRGGASSAPRSSGGPSSIGRSSTLGGGGGSSNVIDSCWMGGGGTAWKANRQKLADCVQGFAMGGKGTTGGKGGKIYVVTTTDDDEKNPPYGSLRWGAAQPGPLWIVFDRDMTFRLKTEILIYSDKTIDGRGVRVSFEDGPGLAVEFESNVIMHGLYFKNNWGRESTIELVTGPGLQLGGRGPINGYGVYIYQSTNIWIDHCYFEKSSDTHIDIIYGTTYVTVSNSFFTNQNKVILMGHSDSNEMDTVMRVTVMLNRFDANVWERMPRGRFGKFHVLNNYYPVGWSIYAIGGSANPTFLSENNFFIASTNPSLQFSKEVTKHNIAADESEWRNWSWSTTGDIFLNGAFFTSSGFSGPYNPEIRADAIDAKLVPGATATAGPLVCGKNLAC